MDLTSKSQALNEGQVPLRVGVIGLGRGFMLSLPTLLADKRVELVAAFDPRESARRAFEEQFGSGGAVVARSLLSPEALCADVSIDLVYIASPHPFHCEQAVMALSHGRHVLVEKPMAISVDECDKMIAAAKANQRHLIVGPSHSFDAPVLKACELIASGQYGAARMLHGLNYTDFLYRPRRPEELQASHGGGVVFSQGAHHVDVARLLLCASKSDQTPIRVSNVRAYTGNWDPLRAAEGAYSALLGFSNGAFASLTYSGYGLYDSDEQFGWIGETGMNRRIASDPTVAKARREFMQRPHDQAKELALKESRTFGADLSLKSSPPLEQPSAHEHFGPLTISCDRADIRCFPDRIEVYSLDGMVCMPLPVAGATRHSVVDEAWAAVRENVIPLHSGEFARGTVAVCQAIIDSARSGREVLL